MPPALLMYRPNVDSSVVTLVSPAKPVKNNGCNYVKNSLPLQYSDRVIIGDWTTFGYDPLF
jgi:hypothetical protein